MKTFSEIQGLKKPHSEASFGKQKGYLSKEEEMIIPCVDYAFLFYPK